MTNKVVKLASMTLYFVNGKISLARCKITGRFVKLAKAMTAYLDATKVSTAVVLATCSLSALLAPLAMMDAFMLKSFLVFLIVMLAVILLAFPLVLNKVKRNDHTKQKSDFNIEKVCNVNTSSTRRTCDIGYFTA